MSEEVLAGTAVSDEPLMITVAKTLKRHELGKKQQKYLFIKRAADFCVSFVSLVILAIPFLIIAVIQKIADPNELTPKS